MATDSSVVTDFIYGEAGDAGTETAAPGIQATAHATETEDQDVHLQDGMDVTATLRANSDCLQAREDKFLRALSMRLDSTPTLPADGNGAPSCDVTSGVLLPKQHCAFMGCQWHGQTPAELRAHLNDRHLSELASPVPGRPIVDVYNEAIAQIECEKVPSVGPSIDRRCYGEYTRRVAGDRVCAMMCITCARVLPYDENDEEQLAAGETRTQPAIRWRRLIKGDRFLGLDASETERIIGYGTYMNEYGRPVPGEEHKRGLKKTGVNLETPSAQQELAAWTLKIPFADRAAGVPVL